MEKSITSYRLSFKDIPGGNFIGRIMVGPSIELTSDSFDSNIKLSDIETVVTEIFNDEDLPNIVNINISNICVENKIIKNGTLHFVSDCKDTIAQQLFKQIVLPIKRTGD